MHASVLLTIILLVNHQAVFSKKSTTPSPSGTWGPWGPWPDSCSRTCGIGVRRRTRVCSYNGPRKEGRCKGPAGRMKNCDTKIMCPIHGGWAPWTSWRCTVSCGGGEGSQKRTCTNPTPMYGGRDCEGDAEEIGKCNEQKCPDEVFTMSPGTKEAIERATKENHNFEKPEGGEVRIPCSQAVIAKIYKEYPLTKLSWAKDGQPLKLDHERMELTPTELSIRKLNWTDVGIYVCSIQYVQEVVKRVTLVALSTVSSKPDIEVHEDETLSLRCRGEELTRILGNTSQQWVLDGKVVKDFGQDSPMKHKWYKVKHVKKNSTGKWACRIKHKTSGREWTANIVVVKVLKSRSKILKFLTNPRFLLAALVVLFVTTMLIGLIFAYVIVKAREDFLEDLDKWSQIVKWEEDKYGGTPPWVRDIENDEWMSEESGDESSVGKADESEVEEEKLVEISD